MRSDPLYSILLDRLTASWVAQPDKPEETPESTLNALCFFAAGLPVSVRKASREDIPELDQDSSVKLQSLVEKRLAGTPLAHITGRQEFLGMELLAGPEALIPRIETEIPRRCSTYNCKIHRRCPGCCCRFGCMHWVWKCCACNRFKRVPVEGVRGRYFRRSSYTCAKECTAFEIG